ncbi:MAG TPA: hypothetical protein VED01_21395 [Burkholderiales bacterium]|nr:hypothetical protein [Burkholderiales bacterium]
MKPYRGAASRLLSKLAPERAVAPAISPPAAVVCRADDYEQRGWDQAFEEELGPTLAAMNAKWEAYGRGEAVPGARPILGASFRGHDIAVAVDDDPFADAEQRERFLAQYREPQSRK